MAEKKSELYDIQVDETAVYLKVLSEAKGKPVVLDQIQNALFELDVDYIPETLIDIYQKGSGEYEFLCTKIRDEHELFIDVTDDRKTAYLTVIPPTDEAESLSMGQLVEALKTGEVVKGIQKAGLQRLVRDQIYNEPTLVAKAKEAIHGIDGFANVVCLERSKQDESALQINFRETNLLDKVKGDTVLAEITPPTKGTNGYHVDGSVIHGMRGRPAELKPGKNTSYNEDRTKIISSKEGFVLIQDQRISVEDIYRVENVDSNTGNINFDGILIVEGNVEDAYTVEATVRIEVYGSVGKSTLKTAGSLQVKQGILGGIVETGGSIEAGFISDSNITCGQDLIITDYVLNSEVQTKQSIIVTGENGFICGGVSKAGRFVRVGNVGSDKTNVHTRIEITTDTELRKKLKKMERNLDQNLGNYEKLKKNLLILQMAREKRKVLPEEHEKLFQEMTTGLESFRDDLLLSSEEWREHLIDMNDALRFDRGVIFVLQQANVGTHIKIQKMNMELKSPMLEVAFSQFESRIEAESVKRKLPVYDKYFEKFRKYMPKKKKRPAAQAAESGRDA